MQKWIKKIKWVAGISTTLAFFAAVPVVHGGLGWTGIDPVLKYGGHTVNVWVEWPSEYTCAIDDAREHYIEMVITTIGATLVSESAETFACADGTTKTIATKTSMNNSGQEGHLQVKDIKVLASETFPVDLLIYVDGALKSSCSGYSNKAFRCGVVQVLEAAPLPTAPPSPTAIPWPTF